MSKEAIQYINATLAAFGPDEAISMTKETWSKLREAMKALAEQPAQQEPVECQYGKGGYACCEGGPCKADEQNNAPKQAQQEPVAYGIWDTMLGKDNRMMMVRLDKGQDGCTVPLYTSPPAQQEPVAYMVKAHGMLQRLSRRADVADELACQYRKDDPNAEVLPLYTSPPAQRTWVGLTDEEVENIFNNWPTYHLDHEDFARAIEAKLREKNS